MLKTRLSSEGHALPLPATAGNRAFPLSLFRRAVSGRPCLLLALVCLLAFSGQGPALAGDIIADESCNLFDAITAANTDRPAGNCPAGNGPDTIKTYGPWIPWGSMGMVLREPLPPITSTIFITIGSGMPGPGNAFAISLQSGVNPVFEVASGGNLTLDGIAIRANRIAGARGLVVRRGGRAELRRSTIAAVPARCGGAIYNEGHLTLSDSRIDREAPFSLTGAEPWTPEPGATLIYINGGSLTDGGIRSNAGPEELVRGDLDCQSPGSSTTFSRPAPECRLPAQLQRGDRAIRSGIHFSNLRAEAGTSGQRVGRAGPGDVVDVIEGPVEADGHNWYRVSSDEGLEGWVAEGPARGFNCPYYFMSFSGTLPPAAPQVVPERQDCDEAQALVPGDHAIIAGGSNFRYRAEPGLHEARRGSLAPGSVMEILDGPETVDKYQWWKVRNPVIGLEGWVAGGAVITGGQCVRWLLQLEAQ